VANIRYFRLVLVNMFVLSETSRNKNSKKTWNWIFKS